MYYARIKMYRYVNVFTKWNVLKNVTFYISSLWQMNGTYKQNGPCSIVLSIIM